jgi:hypothetical protein|tara:strand:- start:293 stop:529 length:237 start_codon:yes stop_codon:yes gene_type:complete
MTAYRIQARVGGKYLDTTLDAPSDKEALDKFVQLASEGKIEEVTTDFYTLKFMGITLEEINVESGKSTNVKEASTPGA